MARSKGDEQVLHLRPLGACEWCAPAVLQENKKRKISVPVSMTQEEASKSSKYCGRTLLQSKIPFKEKKKNPHWEKVE